MDKRSEFEMPIEQRTLLNAGHGPPPIPPGSSVAFGNYRPEIGGPVLLQIIKEKDQQLQKLRNEIHLMQTNSGQKLFDDLVRDNDELQRQLIGKMHELESLKAKYHHLTNELLVSLPDVTARLPHTNSSEDFINLVASGEVARGGQSVAWNLDDHVSMTKSVQCSEPSMEQVTEGRGETKEMEIASPIIEKKGGKISSSSSSSESFEVVGQGSCLRSPAEREGMEMPSMNWKAQLEALQSYVRELSRRLEAVEEERKRETTELKARMDQLSEWEEKVNGRTSAFTPTDRQQEEQAQSLSELTSANWKLTEQNLELTRENEDLKKKEMEWRSAVMNATKLEEELQRKQQRAISAEEELKTLHQLFREREAQIRDVEHMRVAESSEQKGMAFSGSVSDLTTENSLLKHQIEAYKEDFEVERKDREKLVAQKDTLQRCFETLRCDLDVARQQLKKYESDITLLRIDNSTLRTKLRCVTEEVEALKEVRPSTTWTPKAVAPPAQNHRTLVPQPAPQNTFALQKPSPPPSGRHSGDWECHTCTFKNPAPRTFCEMCGTHGPLSRPTAAQAPTCTYTPNIPVHEFTPVQWNQAAASPLLSNLRNYGDIETD